MPESALDQGDLGTGALSEDDAKLLTLARGARARTSAAEGAAVRDDTGRTYAACSVALPSLALTALQAAVAAAVSSGSKGLEAAVVVSEAAALDQTSLTAISDLGGPGAHVLLVSPDGSVRADVTS